MTIFTAGEIYTIGAIQTEIDDVRSMQPLPLSRSHAINQEPYSVEANATEIQALSMSMEAPLNDQGSVSDLKPYLQRLLTAFYEKVESNAMDANPNMLAIGARVKEVNQSFG